MSDNDTVTPFLDSHRADGPVYNNRTTTSSSKQVDSADDVDPRRLTENPSPSELRWYYRNTPFASTIVDKPVDDAVKHGFDIENDPSGKAEAFIDRYDEYRRIARKKARRDGFAAIFFVLNDTGAVSQSPHDVRKVSGLEGFQVLDMGMLTDSMGPKRVADYVDYKYESIDVLEQGIAVVRDITNPDHGKILGYLYERTKSERSDGTGQPVFIHADRCQHFVSNPEVDGNVEDEWMGHVTGHPVLAPVYRQLKALSKGNWSLGQTLFRYTSPLHTVYTPEGYNIDDDHIQKVNKQLDNINAKSALTLPPAHELETHGGDNQLNPEPYVEALVEMLCAGTEMTKSVLMGTQTGTVSGSSTDIKNYHAEVESHRNSEAAPKMKEAARMMFTFDRSVVPSFALGFDVNWGPMVKLSRLDAEEGMTRVMTAATNGINNYLLTPEEARDLIEQEWAELGTNVDLGPLDEEDFDELDRINQHQRGSKHGEAQESESESPRVGQNGGGMPEGKETDPEAAPSVE